MHQKSPKPQSKEFENFKELAKNLIAVPKSDVDKKKAAYENERDKKGKPIK